MNPTTSSSPPSPGTEAKPAAPPSYHQKLLLAAKTEPGDIWIGVKTGKFVLVTGKTHMGDILLQHQSGRTTQKKEHYFASDFDPVRMRQEGEFSYQVLLDGRMHPSHFDALTHISWVVQRFCEFKPAKGIGKPVDGFRFRDAIKEMRRLLRMIGMDPESAKKTVLWSYPPEEARQHAKASKIQV
jgi:hypothetical protein